MIVPSLPEEGKALNSPSKMINLPFKDVKIETTNVKATTQIKCEDTNVRGDKTVGFGSTERDQYFEDIIKNSIEVIPAKI